MTKTKFDFIDIFHAANEIEAGRIVAFLNKDKIESSYYLSTLISTLPDMGSKKFIVEVKNSQKKDAVNKILSAMEDKIISTGGNFI